MHNSQLQNVQQDESLSSVYGVKSNSVLNELEYYHIISGMPSDLAHDLFEGVFRVIKLKRTSTLEETQSNNGRISPTDTPSTSSALTPSTSSALTTSTSSALTPSTSSAGTPSTSSAGTPSTSSAGTPSTSSAGITRPPSPLTPLSRPTSPAVSSSPISIVRNDRKIWPRIYFFPVQTIPQGLRLKLDSQQPLERVDRTRLLDVIYTDVTQYENGLYPSQELYDQIVDGLLRQYPYLIKISGVPLQSVRVYWKEKLKYKWGNERKSRDKHLPEVQARKRKKDTAPTPENISGGKVYLTWSMANFLPAQPESEDDTAISLHCGWLKREFIKTDQNEALINLKMNLTFAARRKAVVEGTISAAELVDQYPFLKDRRQILMEFTRLGPNGKDDRLEDVFYGGLDKFTGPIVSLTKSKKLIPQVKEVVDQIVLLRTEGERKYASQCIAVTSCATLFKEKIEKILFFPGQDSSVSPIALIVCDKLLTMDSNSFELKIDNNTIFSCDTFI
ncbi:uncharacterized protein LOC127703799 [Mytilus californianus]|uniref:uncharacterized protein LOC127703799 n=1 Tax=Mytilus californianus TaxID=6549 RepID=UPI002245D824|nr:uncharacterized protein LOC127703799 [Mytilus californianus]